MFESLPLKFYLLENLANVNIFLLRFPNFDLCFPPFKFKFKGNFQILQLQMHYSHKENYIHGY